MTATGTAPLDTGGRDQPPGPSRRDPPSLVELELADWRCHVSDLYAAVRAERRPEAGHALWRAGRDELFRSHPQSPLRSGDELRTSGLRYFDYDPALRFELPVLAAPDELRLEVPTGADGTTSMRRIGQLHLPSPLGATIDLWWLEQYAGGLFLPFRDATSGDTSYGGGRYVLDTAKSAYLGGGEGSLVVDLNFSYHPSCRYSADWTCPLAPAGNSIDAAVRGGERL